jgi:hypothetical protein
MFFGDVLKTPTSRLSLSLVNSPNFQGPQQPIWNPRFTKVGGQAEAEAAPVPPQPEPLGPDGQG